MEYQPRVVILEDAMVAARHDHHGNVSADAILAFLAQTGDYMLEVFHVPITWFQAAFSAGFKGFWGRSAHVSGHKARKTGLKAQDTSLN